MNFANIVDSVGEVDQVDRWSVDKVDVECG